MLGRRMTTKLTAAAGALFKQHGLALLAAGGCTKMASIALPPGEREHFDALHLALRRWLPGGDIAEINRIYLGEFGRCMEVRLRYNDPRHPSGLAMTGAYLQFYCITPIVGRALPGDGFYDMGFEDFVAVSQRAARLGTSLVALTHRFEGLALLAGASWDEKCRAVDRMLWDERVNEKEYDARLRPIVLHLSSGGAWEWRTTGSTSLLHLPRRDGALSVRLSEAELASLVTLCPGLAQA